MTASTSHYPTPSSASTSLTTKYDVFISFRGIDTRYTFTDFLYHSLKRTGIRAFRDEPELCSGEVISDALLQAIHESKTFIVVFSENYASSPWCLDELVETKSTRRLIIPIFYNIEPSVVRYQTGSFYQAFQVHESRYDSDRLDKWSLTLMNLGNLSGYHVHERMSQVDIINEVVDRVLLEINPVTLDVAKYPVGLDTRVKGIATLLSNNTKSVNRIGIHGMGGVGKTTLAKAVYNENYHRFQGSCFLANVKDVLETKRGLECLQQKLINDVLKCKSITIDNVDQGIELIKARICSTKILIVIDDLDNSMPLEFLEGPFAFGSVVIITTRYEDLLDSIKVEAKYKVKELGDADSRQLFFQHAFADNNISDTFMELSEDILAHAGGLPLALKVCGSNLLNQSEEGWRWFIDKLRRVSLDDVEKKLLISFDTLKLVDPKLQDMFLDIACFFIGDKKKEVVKIMESCYTFSNRNIDILKKRDLLSINDEDELEMHDLLRDMGRKIVCNNCPDEPEKHSRLWVTEDIYDVLKNDKGTEAVEGIIFGTGSFVTTSNHRAIFDHFAIETFKRMSKLKFLYLEYVKLTGSFEQTFKDLRWLHWEFCPLKCLPSDFYPQRLVILALPHSKLTTMWELNRVGTSFLQIPRVFENLKTLNMSYSLDLTTTSDFTRLPYLETLNLEGCERLEELHISIGSLARLVSLNLQFCGNLRSLPDSICNLRALISLNIGCCHRLEVVPINLGDIESLVELNAEDLSVCKFPDSIGHLSNLIELRLSSYNLKSLPDTICNLRSLEMLDIGGTEIRELGSLKELPMELGNIESLKELKAGALGVSKLPESMGHLSKLVKLELRDNYYLENLPDSICNLKALKDLDISSCTSLQVLPVEWGNLESLVELYASELNVYKLPESIRGITSLTTLILADCYHLLYIAELPPNLKWISLENCMAVERLPNLSDMRQLEELNLTGCRGLAEVQGLEDLTSIKTLHLGGCNLSMLANTFTTRFFQIYSSFGQYIKIYTPSSAFPDWISKPADWFSQSSKLGTTVSLSNLGKRVSLELPPKVSHNYLGMILCFHHSGDENCQSVFYSLETTTNDFVWSDGGNFFSYNDKYHISRMDIVPKSVFSVRDGDDRIEFSAARKINLYNATSERIELTENAEILGIHLLYKTESRMIDECDNTIANVESERRYPL